MHAIQFSAPGSLTAIGAAADATISVPNDDSGNPARKCRLVTDSGGEVAVSNPANTDIDSFDKALVLAQDESLILSTTGWSQIKIWGGGVGGDVWVQPLENS